jgi:acetylglutamate kinase
MPRKTAFVKISGDLIGKESVLQWLKSIAKTFFTVICVGGGTQINEAFKERGFPINFGPQGRITETFEERQLARDVLEKNQVYVQDLLAENGIIATVIIPVLDIASVLNHINGDDFVLLATGFDEVYILTLENRVNAKEEQFKNYPKIKVVGF